MQFAIYHESGPHGGDAAKEHHQHYACEKRQHGILGLGVRVLYHLVYQTDVLLGPYQPLAHALAVDFVFAQLFAYAVLYPGSHDDGHQRGVDADHEDVLQLDARAAQQVGADDGCGGCRDGAAGDAERGGYGGDTQRPLGAYLGVGGNLRDDGQEGVAGVGGACHEAAEPRGERAEVGDVGGVAAQKPGGESYEIVQTSGGLQGGCRRDYRHDDEHHVDGQMAGLESEDENEDEHTYHAIDAESYAARAGALEYQCQYDGNL